MRRIILSECYGLDDLSTFYSFLFLGFFSFCSFFFLFFLCSPLYFQRFGKIERIVGKVGHGSIEGNFRRLSKASRFFLLLLHLPPSFLLLIYSDENLHRPGYIRKNDMSYCTWSREFALLSPILLRRSLRTYFHRLERSMVRSCVIDVLSIKKYLNDRTRDILLDDRLTFATRLSFEACRITRIDRPIETFKHTWRTLFRSVSEVISLITSNST